MTADHGDDVLEGADGDSDVDLALGQTPLLDEVGAAHDVGADEAELVDLDAAAQHEPVLAAVDRGEHAAAPFESGLVPDPADPGDEVDRRVAAHARDKALPGRELLLAVFEHRPGERRAGGSADRTEPALVAGGSPPVPRAAGKPARRARRVRPPESHGLVERSRSA